jgi:hypothetical protein
MGRVGKLYADSEAKSHEFCPIQYGRVAGQTTRFQFRAVLDLISRSSTGSSGLGKSDRALLTVCQGHRCGHTSSVYRTAGSPLIHASLL